MTGGDIFKEVGRRWQSLTAEEKLVYKERAKTDTLRVNFYNFFTREVAPQVSPLQTYHPSFLGYDIYCLP